MLADFNCLEVQLQRVLLSSSDPILISGDFNCNLFGPDSDPAKAKLVEFLDSFKGTNPALKKPSNILEMYAKMFGRFH